MNTDSEHHEIVLPKLRGRATYYKVVAWLKEEGDQISPGDSLLIMETDKATVELAAEVAGVLTEIIHFAGEWVEIPSTVGLIKVTPSGQ